jgi:DNA gyrase subunit A
LAPAPSRGKAIVNILPIEIGTGIAAVMPVDRDEAHWDELQIIFATSDGEVRRNALSDFTNVMRNGKIAMKLPEDGSVSLVNARICSESDDVMLVTALGPRDPLSRPPMSASSRAAIRPACAVSACLGRPRGLHGRDPPFRRRSAGTRRLSQAAPPDGRHAEEEIELDEDEENVAEGQLSPERYAEMSAAEDLILTITSGGSGKLSSSHDYPVRGRGGQGVMAMDKAMRGGALVASFPVEMGDQIMLATSTGQSIRVPVDGISFRSRSAGGVKVFNTAKGEEVVSVAWIADQGDTEGETDTTPDTNAE